VSKELLNEELLSYSREINREELSIDSVLKRLERHRRMNIDYSQEIAFIALHFHEIDISDLVICDQSILSRIFLSTELKIKSEDWLYEQIWQLVEVDRMNFTLVQFIRFEFVSTRIARQFIENGFAFIDLIDLSIWSSLGSRFVEEVSVGKFTRQFVSESNNFVRVGTHLTE
jgi:hypothetical protein